MDGWEQPQARCNHDQAIGAVWCKCCRHHCSVRAHLFEMLADGRLGVQETQEGDIDGRAELRGEAVVGTARGPSQDDPLPLPLSTHPGSHVVLNGLVVAS